jgi:hypothetical protein
MRSLLAAAIASAVAACAPVGRSQECLDADACDKALELPFGDFVATDPVFGDDLNGDGNVDGTLTDSGTCWQNAETAKTCAAECTRFIQEQNALAVQVGNQGVIDACGGDLSADEG